MNEENLQPWLEHYDDHIDKIFNPPMITIVILFNRAVQNHPEKNFYKKL